MATTRRPKLGRRMGTVTLAAILVQFRHRPTAVQRKLMEGVLMSSLYPYEPLRGRSTKSRALAPLPRAHKVSPTNFIAERQYTG